MEKYYPVPEGKVEKFVLYMKTRSGRIIYAKWYGLKAFRILVNKDK